MMPEERNRAIGVLTQAMTQAGVSPSDAALAAPALIDEAAKQQGGGTIGAQLAATIGGQLELSEASVKAHITAHDTASRDARLRDERGRFASHDGGHISVVDKVTEPIGMEGARGNSRAVSHDEFQKAAAEGRDRLHAIQTAPWNTRGLDADWAGIKTRIYAEVRKPWGGATVDPRTGKDLPQGADKYAMSIKPSGLDTTSIGEHASAREFGEAMDVAKAKYGNQLAKGGSYLGIFHDDDLGRIDIDPVTVLDSLQEVETIGAWTHAIGGAYGFASGDGFWPPHVPSGAQMSTEDEQQHHWAGPGQWRSQAVAVQQPHDDEPEDTDDTAEEQKNGPPPPGQGKRPARKTSFPVMRRRPEPRRGRGSRRGRY
jgi:hypothetical protein